LDWRIWLQLAEISRGVFFLIAQNLEPWCRLPDDGWRMRSIGYEIRRALATSI
jgi:hypothetical protein